jgi:hypothetical protein
VIDVLKIVYMIGPEDIENLKVLVIDLKKHSQFGFSFLTLYTNVQTDLQPLEDISSSAYRLDLTRPTAEEMLSARCSREDHQPSSTLVLSPSTKVITVRMG